MHRLPDVHLNLNVRGMPPSATVAINDRSNQLRAEGRDVFKLGLGQSPFPVPESVVQALRDNADQKDYLPVQGLYALREVIANRHCRTFDIDADPDDILVGPGSKELMFLLQLTYYGDLVIPSPCWVSYAPQARIIGRQIRYLHTSRETGWHPTAEQIDRLCFTDPGRPRLLILNYPSNPTGRSLSTTELSDLADVARRNSVILLSDEIYAKTDHDGVHHSIAPMYPEGTIFSGGLSKWCGAGGWRLGIFAFPKPLRWLLKGMAAAASETFTSTSAPIQHAAITAFAEGPDIQDYLVHSRRVLGAIGNQLAAGLRDAGAEVLDPQGGFYLFPDFEPIADRLRARGIGTNREMCTRLLEDTGVAILPGADFGRRPTEFTTRLAYVDFDGGAALNGSREVPMGESLDASWVRKFAPRVMEAADRIADWMKG